MKLETNFLKLISKSSESARLNNETILTPEHIILTLTNYKTFKIAYEELDGSIVELRKDLKNYLLKYIDKKEDGLLLKSYLLNALIEDSFEIARLIDDKNPNISHFLTVLFDCDTCFASYFLLKNMKCKNEYELISKLCKNMHLNEIPSLEDIINISLGKSYINKNENKIAQENNSQQGYVIQMPFMQEMNFSDDLSDFSDWKELVSCLNDKVNEKNYIPLVGREKEIEETIAILLKKEKNNPIHIGEAGVGKTAIAEGLAKYINDKKVPASLIDCKIYSCSMGDLISGAAMRGQFENKLKVILKGIEEEKAILYIDEIHTIMGCGGSDTMDAANILKPYLTNGNIKVIGATTNEEYRKHIEPDGSLNRRFSSVIINEPTKEEVYSILKGIKKYYEDFHGCIYSDDILNNIINLSSKYITNKFFPDKAIDLLDETGSLIQLRNEKDKNVTIKMIEEIIAKKCKIPKESVESDEILLIQNIDDNMKKIVIGQDEAIDKIKESIILSRAGLGEENKTVSNLLFVGPTGVGKTYIAQTLADSLNIPLIRKDMSGFSEEHSVSKLIGSPSGYVGFEQGGLLINEIRKNPYCVLLLDEIEKAHPSVHNLFLQVMDDAKLTDSFGMTADFRNVIIIMTSNAGAENIDKLNIGFQQDENNSSMNKEVETIFRPEFRNRLDAIIKFNSMSKEMAFKITINQMEKLLLSLKNKNASVSYSEDVINYIVEKGYSKKYGARNIKRVIKSDIKIILGKELLFGNLLKENDCILNVSNNSIVLEKLS